VEAVVVGVFLQDEHGGLVRDDAVPQRERDAVAALLLGACGARFDLRDLSLGHGAFDEGAAARAARQIDRMLADHDL
jgi:hypothetical protein